MTPEKISRRNKQSESSISRNTRQIKNSLSDLAKHTQRNPNYPTYFIRSEPMGTTDVKNIFNQNINTVTPIKEPTKVSSVKSLTEQYQLGKTCSSAQMIRNTSIISNSDF